MAALAASSLPKSASHDDLAALSISKSASDGAVASRGLARAQSFASTPSLASLAGPPAPPLELEERDAASGLKYVRCMLGAGAAADAPEPPVVFFAHGCAMNAGAWRGALAALHAALCDGGRRLEAVAVDLPGHGRSPAAPAAPAGGGAPPGPDGGGGGAWRGVARALLECLGEVAGDRPVLGVGHSFGAVCLLLAAVDAPDRFAGLALFEPIVAAAGHDAAAVAGDAQCLAALARARHEKLRAAPDLRAALRSTLCAGWDPATARAFLDRGVRRGAPACAAATEAGVFASMPETAGLASDLAAARARPRAVVAAGRRSGALRRLAARDDLAKPHAHLRALESLAGALDCPRLRLKLPRTTTRGGLAIATDRGHALPMEDPPWTAAVVLAAADAFLPRS